MKITPKKRATKGKKIIVTVELNSRIECRKNPFCCELMIKWREIRVQRAWCAFLRIVERLDTFISLSLFLCFLFVRRCGGEKEAFIVLSVRYWNTRGMIVRGESGTSGWKMESRLARRLFLPCRLITSCKHPRLAVNLLKMHAMRFFYPFFFFSLFSLLLFFPFLWFGCESKRASIFSDDCEESLKKLFFAGIPCSRFESREAWTSPSPRDENLIKESLLIALRLSNKISTRVRN